MYEFFIKGNPIFMSILTILLVCMLFSAWKAPKCIAEIGKIAFVTGIVFCGLGIVQIMDVVKDNPDIPMQVFFSGLKLTLFPLIYGCIIRLISLAIQIINKFR